MMDVSVFVNTSFTRITHVSDELAVSKSEQAPYCHCCLRRRSSVVNGQDDSVQSQLSVIIRADSPEQLYSSERL